MTSEIILPANNVVILGVAEHDLVARNVEMELAYIINQTVYTFRKDSSGSKRRSHMTAQECRPIGGLFHKKGLYIILLFSKTVLFSLGQAH